MAKSSPVRKLVAAIKKGDVGTVTTALDAGVDLSALSEDIPPLGWAVYENQPEIVRLLLDAGSDVDVPQEDGTTPLQCCSSIRSEHLSDDDAVVIATMLIERGADVMACAGNHECAPLPMAVSRGKKKLAKLLIAGGAKAFSVTVTMKDEHGQPLPGEYYFGIPGGEFPVAEVKRSGRLKLENVFPGEFLIGRDGDEQLVTINDDGSVTPDVLMWATE